MNRFMSNLVCEGFHHVLLKYGHENAKMQQKLDYVTLRYSIVNKIIQKQSTNGMQYEDL